MEAWRSRPETPLSLATLPTFWLFGSSPLSSFDLSNIQDNAATFWNDATAKVDDGNYAIVKGSYSGGTFTYDGGGTDLLYLWDGNPSDGAVTMVGVVLTNTSSLTVGTTLLFG